MSDLSGVRIDQSTAGAETERSGSQHVSAERPDAPPEQHQRGEGAVSRFFRALFGRKS